MLKWAKQTSRQKRATTRPLLVWLTTLSSSPLHVLPSSSPTKTGGPRTLGLEQEIPRVGQPRVKEQRARPLKGKRVGRERREQRLSFLSFDPFPLRVGAFFVSFRFPLSAFAFPHFYARFNAFPNALSDIIRTAAFSIKRE